MKGKLKLKSADNLAPIRIQIKDLIEPNSRVIEFGCATGDLLFKLSPKIEYGLGIDKSNVLIDHATEQKEKIDVNNVDFLCQELGASFMPSGAYDFSIASLFFHVIPITESIYLLHKMKEVSDNILICGFSRPETLHQKTFLWLDQRFSNHYRNFAAHQKHGYMEGLFEETGYSDYEIYDTSIPFVKIYKTVTSTKPSKLSYTQT